MQVKPEPNVPPYLPTSFGHNGINVGVTIEKVLQHRSTDSSLPYAGELLIMADTIKSQSLPLFKARREACKQAMRELSKLRTERMESLETTVNLFPPFFFTEPCIEEEQSKSENLDGISTVNMEKPAELQSICQEMGEPCLDSGSHCRDESTPSLLASDLNFKIKQEHGSFHTEHLDNEAYFAHIKRESNYVTAEHNDNEGAIELDFLKTGLDHLEGKLEHFMGKHARTGAPRASSAPPNTRESAYHKISSDSESSPQLALQPCLARDVHTPLSDLASTRDEHDLVRYQDMGNSPGSTSLVTSTDNTDHLPEDFIKQKHLLIQCLASDLLDRLVSQYSTRLVGCMYDHDETRSVGGGEQRSRGSSYPQNHMQDAQSNAPTAGSSSRKGKRRRLDSTQNEDQDDEDGERNNERSKNYESLHWIGESSNFACPFYQRVPSRHQKTACIGPGFPTIKTLKWVASSVNFANELIVQ